MISRVTSTWTRTLCRDFAGARAQSHLFFSLSLVARGLPQRCPFVVPRRAEATGSSIDEESVDFPFVVPPATSPIQKHSTAKLRDLRLGFIGWGAMAQAMSLGILRKALTSHAQIMVTDIQPSILSVATREGFQTSTRNTDLVSWADIVVIAVKPQVVEKVLGEVASSWRTREQLLVSICAGVTIGTYNRSLGNDAKIVRVMPNVACLIGEAATGYAASNTVSDLEIDIVHSMFASVGGATHRVPEHLLNTVTGLSGSGPAYVYMMIQALSDAGVHGGLPRNVALSLAAQTVIGAAKMVQESGQHPMVLQEAVTSPAGTTIAGVRTLERMNFRAAVIEAVETARARSEALSETSDHLVDKKKT